jgi:hypothetical protein
MGRLNVCRTVEGLLVFGTDAQSWLKLHSRYEWLLAQGAIGEDLKQTRPRAAWLDHAVA